ncbi:MAG: BlaI/MecI/CopY family transcriptional regulator [Pyrinomonadaceae bacterium]
MEVGVLAKPKAKKLTELKSKVMNGLRNLEPSPIRECREHFPAQKRPAYTTSETIVYGLEKKGMVKRTKKIGNAHIFEPLVTRWSGLDRFLHDVLTRFGCVRDLLD